MISVAPARWHSPGSVIDQPYEALDALARGARAAPEPSHRTTGAMHAGGRFLSEPQLSSEPPADLQVDRLDPAGRGSVQGREVWLVHPWALREPPEDVPADATVVGIYLREYHAAWPWAEARWRWVDAAMRQPPSPAVEPKNETVRRTSSTRITV